MYIRDDRSIFYKIKGMMKYIDNAKSRYIQRILPIIRAAEDNNKLSYALKMYDKLLFVMSRISEKYFIPESWFEEVKERKNRIDNKMIEIKKAKEEHKEYIATIKTKLIFFVKVYVCVWIAVICIAGFTYLSK